MSSTSQTYAIPILLCAVFVAVLGYVWPPESVLLATSLSTAGLFNSHSGKSGPARDLHVYSTDECTQLAEHLRAQTYGPHDSLFEKLRYRSFAAQARDDVPDCVVRPESVEQLSTAVKVLKKQYDRDAGTRFAVRSGGHATSAGHSTIHAGVLIDMAAFNEIAIERTQHTVVLGVGSRWGEVYKTLDRENLHVVGGRDAGVGVGGLILGGGISYLSTRFGLACDNVIQYEIVLANGTIAQVTDDSHAELFLSLKGGSSNFGIVTRVTVRTFPGSDIWGGHKYWWASQSNGIMGAFYDFVANETLDEGAASPVITYGYHSGYYSMGMGGFFAHTEAELTWSQWPESLRMFQGFWSIWGNLKRRSIGSLAEDLNYQSLQNARQAYATITVKNDRELLQTLPALFDQHKAAIKTIAGVVFNIVVQPLVPGPAHTAARNVLNLPSRNSSERPLVIVLAAAEYSQAADDRKVREISRAMLEDVQKHASVGGHNDPFIYLNYADPSWQDPIASYGDQNLKLMRSVSRRYDPDGFFQIALEGGFKLGMYSKATTEDTGNRRSD